MGCLGTVWEMSLWDYHFACKGYTRAHGGKPDNTYPTEAEFEATLKQHGLLH